jgi:hypothetical protein
LHERTARDQLLVSEQLQNALHSRILIEQAKGVLSARAGTSVEVAFRLMRAHARRTGSLLTTVADGIVSGAISAEQLQEAPRPEAPDDSVPPASQARARFWLSRLKQRLDDVAGARTPRGRTPAGRVRHEVVGKLVESADSPQPVPKRPMAADDRRRE